MVLVVRRPLLLAFAAWLAVAFAVPASTAVSATDGRDTESTLDVKRVYHQVTSNAVMFGLETHDAFDEVKDFYQLRWDFDLNGDGNPREGCMLLEQVAELPGDRRLRATLYPRCGAESWSTNDATRPGANVTEITLPMRDLVNGMEFKPGAPVSYRVTAADLRGHKDVAPDAGLVSLTNLQAVPTEPPLRQVLSVQPPSGEGVAAGAQLNELALSGPQGSVDVPDAESSTRAAPTPKSPSPMPLVAGALAAGFLLGALVVVALRRSRSHAVTAQAPPAAHQSAPRAAGGYADWWDAHGPTSTITDDAPANGNGEAELLVHRPDT